MEYSKLVSWSVENFMGIEKGTVTFDDKGIINIKGYNDSGKSALLRALDVLFFNIKPNSQVSFIKDGTDYFRIMAKFDDGVIILRDKYANGQSLYEMYKGEELLYTTKVNGVLSRVKDVPEPIQQYLGLIEYEGTLLNSRSCFEKQLLVQTSGGDNYKLLNAVLKSEELATASTILNKDKNAVGLELNKATSELDVYENMAKDLYPLTDKIVEDIEAEDNKLTELEDRQTKVGVLQKQNNLSREIFIPSEAQSIDVDKLTKIYSIRVKKEELDKIVDIPEASSIDTNKFMALHNLVEALDKYKTLPVQQEAGTINIDTLLKLKELLSAKANIDSVNSSISDIDTQLETVNAELSSLEGEDGLVRCPNCGELIAV